MGTHELISALRFLGAAAAWFVVFSLSTFFVLSVSLSRERLASLSGPESHARSAASSAAAAVAPLALVAAYVTLILMESSSRI